MNPIAISFWICATAIGFIVNGDIGAATGLAIATGISVVLSLLE